MLSKACAGTTKTLALALMGVWACDHADASVGDSPDRRAALPQSTPRLSSSRNDVHEFVSWAGRSNAGNIDVVRRTIAAMNDRGDMEAIASAIYAEAIDAIRYDHSRALITLGVLGTFQNRFAEAQLVRFVRRPLSRLESSVETGEAPRSVSDTVYEPTEAEEMLQAKAIDGVAFQHTQRADAEVLRTIQEHPSRIVRAEAISAYLWNHGDTQIAKSTVTAYVREDEAVFVDRVRRTRFMTAATADLRLAAYLATHPDRIAPAPKHRSTPREGAPRTEESAPTNPMPPPLPE